MKIYLFPELVETAELEYPALIMFKFFYHVLSFKFVPFMNNHFKCQEGNYHKSGFGHLQAAF